MENQSVGSSNSRREEPEIYSGGDELSRYESNVSASRTLSRRLTGADELIEKAKESKEPLPQMGGGRPYPPTLPDREQFIVSYDGPDDPIHPHNFPLRKKVIFCFIVGFNALGIVLGSAMFSSASAPVELQYHVGSTVGTLGTSLFVFGFASGPIIWGPMSELFGRKKILVCSSFVYVCFSFASATAENIQTIMITRFFAGFTGAAPLVAAPAAMADLFGVRTRGQATSIFAMVLFGGPMIAPILSAFIVKNPHMGWRWTMYITGIVAAAGLLLDIFVLEETHHPLILVRKAEILRRRTGNWGIVAPHEEITLDIREVAEKNLTRPLRMLFTEPILFLITIYNAFIYGILYLFLTAIPLIFQGKYHFIPGVAELPYLGMLIGILIGGMICVFFERRFLKAMDDNGGKPVPEERLPPMMLGAFLFAGGLFMLCWAGHYAERVHWIVPTLGAALSGTGLITIFLPCLNYIIDCYLFFAASALAGNTFLRSAFGAVFPLFARQMFEHLGIQWGGTLLGCFSLLLAPVPFLFYKYGKALRQKSKYAFDL
ncbi:hypothetical protein CANTEDRAFT_115464 [Yamadazyma tenuis ATCC 10573]|uniref:Major facilitator superfamily (MFS) profile domain-containing protein n=1 Tax=Candida tenuis (strain ATCC 10573 / BCRC 21748 / CBS 615 / JCM 9827 / NBRC 10315 / NRRL Y-1498 / VKM Y-70) TaxID=590646 RepID=G3BA33_CANTC|nr:uncharacterized protein CANTEDRAFT_115464 [Yamadazyma tenuis ATCC 10573]EGV62000.1 hypothetical protein CANTEDRAFT_115464 [Yamadazyma tenuis ATCC 10573]